MKTLTPIAVELPPTATYAAREAEWVPVSDTEGVLVIRLRKTLHGKEEADVYAVEEQVSGHPAVREFLLENTADTPDTYRVAVGNGWETCTCKAALCKLECKHRSTMLALLATGEV